MKNVVVRLQEIIMNNFKNVEYGKVSLQSYVNFNKNINMNLNDILGIYGQNGSGKTALVDALEILKLLLSGEKLPKDMNYLINSVSQKAVLQFTFLIERLNERYFVYYSVEITKGDYKINSKVSKETISFSPILDNKKKPKSKIIDFDMDYENIIKPMARYNEIINVDKNNAVNLGVSKVYALEEGTSFIFNDRSIKIFNEGFIKNTIFSNIINSLKRFAELNLFVIKSEQLGVVNMNQLLPLTFQLESENRIISGDYATLFGTSTISEDSFILLQKIINQINIVINSIIPGMIVDIIDYGQQLDENGDIKIKVELVSVRGENKVPLRYESDGIKKILSILSAMISMYNKRDICLVVDELDAGIFEYLLGEILNVLQENARGQFIFTSHNLRALEKLNKESIIFTTTNPKNRYIKLANVKSNNNLRDFYLRVISLGGQKEDVYEETNTYEINYAFRKAGRLLDEE